MPVRKRGDVWYYDFQIRVTRYRGSIPEARLKSEAEQAEVERRKEVFEGRYGRPRGAKPFAEFVGDPEAENDEFAEGTYLDWARTNKKTWRHDRFRARVLIEAFRGKTLSEVSPLLIEKFKRDRRKSIAKRKTERSSRCEGTGIFVHAPLRRPPVQKKSHSTASSLPVPER